MKLLQKTLLFITAFLVAGTLNSFSQNTVNGGGGGFQIGSKLYNTENYNFFLPDGVNDQLENNLITVGGGGYKVINNFMIGGRGFYLSGDSQDFSINSPRPTPVDYTYSLDGGGGYFTLGYVLLSNSNLIAFPQLGIGYEILTLSRNLNSAVSASNRENLSAEYRWSSPMLDIGIGADLFLIEKIGLKVGIRGGYNLSLSRDADWNHGGGEFVGSALPKNNLDSFYFGISIGYGGIENKHHTSE